MPVANVPRPSLDHSERHIKEEHYWWSYIYVLAHLKFKPRTELTGVEAYLLQKVRKLVCSLPICRRRRLTLCFVGHQVLDNDLSWVPMHRAMALSQNKNTVRHNHVAPRLSLGSRAGLLRCVLTRHCDFVPTG